MQTHMTTLQEIKAAVIDKTEGDHTKGNSRRHRKSR
jgi:hypothetical protein